MKKVVAFLQARSDSTRLPKKVLKTILDKPMIVHQFNRTSKSKYISELILLTSDESSDDELALVIKETGYNVFRGNKNNVLKRFYDASKHFGLNEDDVIVRLTGDCPLHDSNIIDECIESFLNEECDYLTNSVKPIYPDGLDVEVFSVDSLYKAYSLASLDSEKEHVTPYIRNSGEFNCKNLEKEPIHNDWRLTVDEENDFKLIVEIFKHFNSTYFSFEEIINFLENNLELLELNCSIKRNEGYEKSIKEDESDK